MSEAAVQDAPSTSEAHQKFVFRDSRNSFAAVFKAPDGKRTDINVPVSQAGNNMEAAARICRWLYHKMETGATKEEVLALKKSLLAASAQAVKRPHADPAQAPQKKLRSDEGSAAAGADVSLAQLARKATPPAAKKEDVRRPGELPKAAAKAPATARAPAGPPPFPREDVPDGSAAYGKVLWHRTEGNYYCYFRVTLPGGRKFQQQVTCDSKSEQTAARLCRLIYHMWEKGASEDAVKVYRTQICAAWNAHRKLALVKDETPEKEFKGSKSCDKRAKQHKKDNDKSCDKRDKQQGEGSSAGSRGRQAAPQQGLALDIGDAKESSAAWTRVWWHQSRCHWFFRWSTDKVTITFQVTERAAQGDRELAARICRRCFEKIEAGGTKEEADALKKDLLERCCARPAAGPRSPSRPAAAPASGAAAPAAASGATPGAKEGPGEEKGEDSETDQESESSRSGGGSSGSSSSGSDSDADAASGSESDDSCLFEKESGAQAPVAAGSGTAAGSGSLPANWEAVFDENHQCYYYFNASTEVSQWEMPRT